MIDLIEATKKLRSVFKGYCPKVDMLVMEQGIYLRVCIYIRGVHLGADHLYSYETLSTYSGSCRQFIQKIKWTMFAEIAKLKRVKEDNGN